MARYTGPKSKIARKFKDPIFGADKTLEKKNYPPGMHGQGRRRGKQSEYAVQLAEKQKAKYTYGILERQFSNLFKKASSKSGITGELLLQLCESRLDNVNIPSYSIKVGEVIAVREKSKSLEKVTVSLANRTSYDWLDWNSSEMSGEVKIVPTRDQIPENIKEQLIVELYSK